LFDFVLEYKCNDVLLLHSEILILNRTNRESKMKNIEKNKYE